MRKFVLRFISIVLCASFLIIPTKTAEAVADAQTFKNSQVKNLKVVYQSTSKIQIKWDELNNADDYCVLRANKKNGTYAEIYGTTDNNFEDDTIQPGKTYYYMVYAQALSKGGKVINSKKSSVLTVTAQPAKPTIKVKADSNNVTITISKVKSADGYAIYMSTDKDKNYDKIKTIKAGASLSYTKTGLNDGKTYYFKVRAYYKENGKTYWGSYSNIKTIKLEQKVTLKPGDGIYGDFKYVYSDNELSITGYSGNATELTVPAQIKGVDVISIGREAFYGCESLVTVKIPDTVTVIKEDAFDECSNLTNVILSNSLREIGDDAFSETNISTITIPDSVTEIGDGAFAHCTNLVDVTIPSSVTEIGDGAFALCTNLVDVTIPSSVTEIGPLAFYNTPWYDSLTDEFCIFGDGVLIKYNGTEENLVIPGNVKNIGGRTFSGFYNEKNYFKTVTIPEGVVSIGEGAFSYCRELTKVTLPNTLVKIDDLAFVSCEKLPSITLPSSITFLGYRVFDGCGSETTNLAGGHTPFIIFMEKGSYAEEWARKEGYTIMSKEKINETYGPIN